MVKLNVSCYIIILIFIKLMQLFELWLKDHCIHYYWNMSLLVVAYFGYPPSVSNSGSAVMSWWFLKLQSLYVLAMHVKSRSSLQGLQILLMSGVSLTSALQILEAFWNIWSQVSDFPARGPGMYTLSWGIHVVAVAVRRPGKLKSTGGHRVNFDCNLPVYPLPVLSYIIL